MELRTWHESAVKYLRTVMACLLRDFSNTTCRSLGSPLINMMVLLDKHQHSLAHRDQIVRRWLLPKRSFRDSESTSVYLEMNQTSKLFSLSYCPNQGISCFMANKYCLRKFNLLKIQFSDKGIWSVYGYRTGILSWNTWQCLTERLWCHYFGPLISVIRISYVDICHIHHSRPSQHFIGIRSVVLSIFHFMQIFMLKWWSVYLHDQVIGLYCVTDQSPEKITKLLQIVILIIMNVKTSVYWAMQSVHKHVHQNNKLDYIENMCWVVWFISGENLQFCFVDI